MTEQGRSGGPLSYEAELTRVPNNRCFGWGFVTYRVEGGDREVVAHGGSYTTREYALEKAQEAAVKDRGLRMFDPLTGRSYNIHLGPGNGEEKIQETVALHV